MAVVLSSLFIEQYIILYQERPEKTEMVHLSYTGFIEVPQKSLESLQSVLDEVYGSEDLLCNPLLSSSLSNCVLPFSFNRRSSGSSLKCCNMLLLVHSTSHLNKNHLLSCTPPAEIWAASTLFLRQLSWQPVKKLQVFPLHF